MRRSFLCAIDLFALAIEGLFDRSVPIYGFTTSGGENTNGIERTATQGTSVVRDLIS